MEASLEEDSKEDSEVGSLEEDVSFEDSLEEGREVRLLSLEDEGREAEEEEDDDPFPPQEESSIKPIIGKARFLFMSTIIVRLLSLVKKLAMPKRGAGNAVFSLTLPWLQA